MLPYQSWLIWPLSSFSSRCLHSFREQLQYKWRTSRFKYPWSNKFSFFTQNMDNPPSTSNTLQVRPSHFISDRKTPPPASNFNVITHLLYQNKPTVKNFKIAVTTTLPRPELGATRHQGPFRTEHQYLETAKRRGIIF